MTDPPFFSVLCVCYNEASYLQECLDSVRGQTDPSWELILIDDHSNDATFEIMTAAAAADPRITALRNPVKSKVAGFNHAVERSRGQWVHLLGGDDMLAPNCLQECRRVIEAAGPAPAAVYHDYTILNKRTGVTIRTAVHSPWLAEATVEAAWREKYGVGGGFIAIRHDLARTVIWPQPTDWKNEDTALAACLKVLGEVRYLPLPLYFYRLAEQHHYIVPTLESHLKDLVHFIAGLEQLRERRPDAWAALSPEALEEADRHFRHAALLSSPNWTLGQAWQSRLGMRRFAMASIYRCGPRAYSTLVGLYRWLRNLRVGLRSAR
jgi:glycosyltransferase involved in cell wall biosynthesis